METVSAANDIYSYAISSKYQFTYYIRSKRFIGLLILTIVITAALIMLDLHYKYTTLKTENSAIFFNGFLSSDLITFFAVIAAFFGGDLVSMDLGTNTAYYTLVQPIRRSVLYIGRYTSAFLASAVMVLIVYIGGMAMSLYLYGNITDITGISFALALLYMLALLSFSSLFSAIFRTPTIGLVMSIIFLIIIYPAIQGILSGLAGVNPWMFVTYAGQILYLVFEKKYTTYAVTHVGRISFYTFNPTLLESIYIMLGYIVIFLLISAAVFTYKEIKG
ncbi:hypothetical protein [Thermoplasma volcanium GSS1]|uniref:Uncharacterized protein n=1 Tax=Thermoplasma volcanium (strain ATCC 51530 / DSM 4299 / JCM 9571 / NBRC 15438 / GSS1) TaxID=273116 RepID=Q97CD5_THEVO|nr:ABC transporter permease [Thermoplasma volcanium]BAB59309.1 hypothetical protein [Thermoplasma volcanium GSS1]